jgi:UDPglucose 6-dehydrogenase
LATSFDNSLLQTLVSSMRSRGTQWAEYRELDFERIFNEMVKPAFIFDGRNHLDHKKLFEIGFNIFPLGKPPLKHV